MANETIKYRLQQYKRIKENIKDLEDMIIEIDTKLQKITTNLSVDKVQTTKDIDKWSELISKKITVETKLKMQLLRMYEEIEFIETKIDKLDEIEKKLIRLRYYKGMKWEEICVELNYSWSQTHDYHSKILKKLNSG